MEAGDGARGGGHAGRPSDFASRASGAGESQSNQGFAKAATAWSGAPARFALNRTGFTSHSGDSIARGSPPEARLLLPPFASSRCRRSIASHRLASLYLGCVAGDHSWQVDRALPGIHPTGCPSTIPAIETDTEGRREVRAAHAAGSSNRWRGEAAEERSVPPVGQAGCRQGGISRRHTAHSNPKKSSWRNEGTSTGSARVAGIAGASRTESPRPVVRWRKVTICRIICTSSTRYPAAIHARAWTC